MKVPIFYSIGVRTIRTYRMEFDFPKNSVQIRLEMFPRTFQPFFHWASDSARAAIANACGMEE